MSECGNVSFLSLSSQGEIRAVAFNEVADKLQSQMELGQVRFTVPRVPVPFQIPPGVLRVSRKTETSKQEILVSQERLRTKHERRHRSGVGGCGHYIIITSLIVCVPFHAVHGRGTGPALSPVQLYQHRRHRDHGTQHSHWLVSSRIPLLCIYSVCCVCTMCVCV